MQGSIDRVEFFADIEFGQVEVQGSSYLFEPSSVDRLWTINGDFNVLSGGDADIITDVSTNAQLDLIIGGTLFIDSVSEMFASNGSVTTQFLDVDGLLVVQTIKDPSALIVTSASATDIGDTSSATLTVRQGASASFAGAVNLGVSGTAGAVSSFNIESDSDVTLTDLAIGGGAAGTSSGTLTLTGSGTTLIQTGGASLTIGGATGTGAGSLIVDDNASFTTGTGGVTVGDTGSITVNSGGTLTLKSDLTMPTIAPLTNDGGTVIVDGSTTSVTGSVSFGSTGTTTYDVINGGEFSYQYAWLIGRTAGETGSTTVSGVNGPDRSSLLATGGGGGADVVVGYDGYGTLDVLDGGLVSAGDDLYVGRNIGSAGVLTVDGVNGTTRSTVLVTRNNSLNSNIYVGSGQSSTAGAGEMNITGGALVQTSGSVNIGQVAGSNGLITINGDGGGFDSELIAANDIIIGGTEGASGGTGTISAVGGAITAGDMIRIWPDGTLSTMFGTTVSAPLIEVNGGTFDFGGGNTDGDLDVINGGSLISDNSFGLNGAYNMHVSGPGSYAHVYVRFDPANGASTLIDNGALLEVREMELQAFVAPVDIVVDNATIDQHFVSNDPGIIMDMELRGAFPATLTFQNNALGSFDGNAQFTIGEAGPNNGTDSVNVLSGSDVTIGKIVMGNIISSVNVDGPGSTLTLVNALDGETLDMSLGGAMNVSNSGELTLGTGDARAYNVTLTTGGILTRPSTTTPLYFWGNNDITGGVFNADGHIEIDSLGTLTADSASLQLGTGKLVTLTGTSTLNLQDTYAFDDTNTLRIDGLFSTLNAASDLSFTSGSHLRVSAGTNTLPGTLTIGGTAFLSMSPGTGSPAMLTVNNLDLQAGSTLNLDSGVLEIDGVLTNGNSDLLLDGFSIHSGPKMRFNPGSSASISGDIIVEGENGRTLEVISNCCQATTLDSDDLFLGETTGTYGSALISGSQASVTVGNNLYVGAHRLGSPAGTGSLTVETGADVVVDNLLTIGSRGTGTMALDNGASVVVGYASVGVGSGGDGALHISGGVLQTIGAPFPSPNFGSLFVGSIGIGLIDGTDGLIDINDELIVGNDGGDGTVDLEGTDLNAYAIRVGTGTAGIGLLNLDDSSQANITQSIVLGETAGSSGTLNVTPDSGTAADLTVGTELIIGAAGDGTFSAGYGSDVISPIVKIAELAGSTGSASVTGTSGDSDWDGDIMYIGGGGTGAGGTGTMTVGNGGNLNFTNTIRVWSTGTLNIQGGNVTTGVLNREDISQGALNWTSGDLTLTNSDLSVGTGTTTNFFLGDNYTLPHSGVLTISGEAVIGDPVITGPGTLVIRDRMVTGLFERTLVGAAGSLTLDSATLDTSILELRTGAVFAGEGTVDGRVLAHAGSTLTVNGNLTLGDATRFDGVIIDTNLQVGSNTLTLQSKGFVPLGPLTTIANGQISAPNGIALGPGDVLSGGGSILAEVAAAAGSIIDAGDNLSLGDSNAYNGFVSDGRLDVNNFTTTLRDANEAILPSWVTLGVSGVPGTLRTSNGAVLETGKAMTGYGTTGLNVIGADDPARPFVNNGTIIGDFPWEPITMEGFVKGVGTFDNVVFTGTFAPGLSPAVISAGSLAYAGNLEVELGGTIPGSEYDQINHSGAATLGGILDLLLINDFIPVLGETFLIITANNRVGTFSSITGTDLGGGLAFDVLYGLNDVTLQVISTALDGDLDGDGFVGITDLNIVLSSWNQNVPPANPAADPSGDNFIGIEDLNIVLGNWNAGTPPTNSDNIPEPASVGLLMICCGVLLRRAG